MAKFSEELFNKICEEIATSANGLHKICKKNSISPSIFYKWISEDNNLLDIYTRAREQQADLLADQIIEIADDGSNDTIKQQIRNNKGEVVSEIDIEDKEWTNRSKLRVEARKWIAAKLKPKKYADRIDQDINVSQLQPLFPDVSKDNSDK